MRAQSIKILRLQLWNQQNAACSLENLPSKAFSIAINRRAARVYHANVGLIGRDKISFLAGKVQVQAATATTSSTV